MSESPGRQSSVGSASSLEDDQLFGGLPAVGKMDAVTRSVSVEEMLQKNTLEDVFGEEQMDASCSDGDKLGGKEKHGKGWVVLVGAVLIAVVAVLMRNAGEPLKREVEKVMQDSTVPPPGSVYKATYRPTATESEVPDEPVMFTIHFNGDGLGDGLQVSTDGYHGLNELIREYCAKLPEVYEFAQRNNETVEAICEPNNGARLFMDSGARVYSLLDVPNHMRTYIVPVGIQFVFPLKEVGSVIFPDHVPPPMEGKPIRLKQLSMSPRVFLIDNFISDEEIDAIIEHNREVLKPSEVGFSGWKDSTRTSSTAWDFNSWAAKRVRRRSFDLVGMDFIDDMADAVQVLRYREDEWYKPHTDYFDEKGYQGHDPIVQNGTNRFATVFVYLSDVDEGGNTVFPLSTTHEGYNGEQIVHPGTENTPGYISNADARWACNASSTALRSPNRRGGALLFYSQNPDSSLDKFSLHGGCPPVRGVKYSANVWLWNRPKPSKDKAKDRKQPAVSNDSIQVVFSNQRDTSVNLFWDDGSEEGIFQGEITARNILPMTTYHSHRFLMKDAVSNETLQIFVANDRLHKGKEFVVEIH